MKCVVVVVAFQIGIVGCTVPRDLCTSPKSESIHVATMTRLCSIAVVVVALLVAGAGAASGNPVGSPGLRVAITNSGLTGERERHTHRVGCGTLCLASKPQPHAWHGCVVHPPRRVQGHCVAHYQCCLSRFDSSWHGLARACASVGPHYAGFEVSTQQHVTPANRKW